LTDIFTFLFTTKGKELDMQTRHPKKYNVSDDWEYIEEQQKLTEDMEQNKNEPLSPPIADKYEQIQKSRIQKAIIDMFGRSNESAPSETQPGKVKSPFYKNFSKSKTAWLSRMTAAILLTIICLGSPFLLYIGSFLFRGWALTQAATGFKEGKSAAVSHSIRTEAVWSGYTRLTMPLVHALLRLLLGDKTVQAYERMDKLLDVLAEVETELLTINEAVLSIGSSLLLEKKDKQALSPVVAVDTIRKSIPGIKNKLDLASTYLQSCDNPRIFPFSLPYVSAQIEKASAKIEKLRQIAGVGERISQIYPFVGGFKDKQTMLVLLQNSGELRPTGGFIGSLAHLTVSEGALVDIRIEDVYALDGQLKGHVDPPIPIRDVLAQEHWYLRDSNWNPDFAQTARDVQFFYEKETGEKVDNVVGITSSFVVKILRITGPVEIPLYNDRITADNFYLKSLFYTQANFFPGSSQKKDFLGSLMEALLIKLQTNPQSGIAIMEIIHDSLASRDIQWYTSIAEGQQAVERFGWGGKVPTGTTCLTLENQPQCIFTYMYINEANLSVNKVNTFIDRSQMRSILISDEGKITETITRKIMNLSQGESGTGTYTTYIRIFFPSGNMLTNLTLDGKPVTMKDEKTKSQTLPYGEIDTSVPGLTGIGVAFDVEPGRERIISASVSYGETIMTDKKEALMTVFEQKQAGVDSVQTTTMIGYPPMWETALLPSAKKGDVIAKKGYLEYNTILSEDNEFSFRLMR